MDMGEDVVFSILLWLPVSALLRFKSVCKSWQSLIESSDFITQHLHHQHQQQEDHDLIILDDKVEPLVPSCRNKDYSDRFYEDVNFTLLSGNNFQFSRNLGFSFRFQSPIHSTKIISSCHGLICLDLGYGDPMVDDNDKYNPDIALWNPATRQFKILPDAPVGVSNPDASTFLTYGLGFDAKTNDYKVVRILIIFLDWSLHFSTPVKTRTDVYSLSTDSWITVENASVLPVHTITQNPYVPFQDGIYCWLGGYRNDSEAHRDLIFSFDFGSEEFGAIPVPDVYVDDSARPWLSLSFLKENIACIIKPDACYSPTTDIWILNQYDVTDSWIKLYTITLEDCFSPFGFSKNGKIFWEQTVQSQGAPLQLMLNLSDPVTHELNILAVEQPTRNLQVAHYKESLVSIKGAIGATAIGRDIYVDFF